MSKILHLTLTKNWFELMVRGIKRVEFREQKPYWEKRLFNRINDTEVEAIHFDEIHFRNGYGKDKPLFVTDHITTMYSGKVNRTRPFKLKTDYPCFSILFSSVTFIKNYKFSSGEIVWTHGKKGVISHQISENRYLVKIDGKPEERYWQEFKFDGSTKPLYPEFVEFFINPIQKQETEVSQ